MRATNKASNTSLNKKFQAEVDRRNLKKNTEIAAVLGTSDSIVSNINNGKVNFGETVRHKIMAFCKNIERADFNQSKHKPAKLTTAEIRAIAARPLKLSRSEELRENYNW